jgi:hypothetical protein
MLRGKIHKGRDSRALRFEEVPGTAYSRNIVEGKHVMWEDAWSA